MATLNQIAEKVGVAKSTVSLVLSGRSQEMRISKSLTDRVLTASRQMGYKPDGAARALFDRKSYQIGILLRNSAEHPSTNPAAFQFLLGVNLALEKASYTVCLVRVEDLKGEGVPQSRVFREHMLDGIIVFGDLPPTAQSHIDELSKNCVRVNTTAYAPQRCIRRDELDVGRTIARVAIEKGYRRFLWVEALGNRHYSAVHRLQGLMEEAARHGCEVATTPTLTWADSPLDLYYPIARQATPDTAVVAYNTQFATRLGLAAARLRLVAGEDFGLACCDESFDVLAVWRELSRMGYDHLDLGRIAAEMMLRIIADPAGEHPSLAFPGCWRAGETFNGPIVKPLKPPGSRSRAKMVTVG